MKTLHTIMNRYAGIGRVFFGIFLLTAPTLFAQTFTGRDYLAESPVNFQAFVYPAQHKPVINIRIENRSAHAVRIQIKNEAQQTVYDDYVSKQKLPASSMYPPYHMALTRLNLPTALPGTGRRFELSH